MIPSEDVHKQFATYFERSNLSPYLYLLSKKLQEGHVCIDVANIDSAELKAAGFHKIPNIETLKEDTLVTTENGWQPFVLSKDKLYLQRYFHYETMVLEAIQGLILQEKGTQKALELALLKKKSLIRKLFPAGEKTEVDWQLIAALSAVMNKFTIITGGPGTGKTTTVAKVLTLLFQLQSDLKVALAAPTGKAAMRMAESLKKAEVDEKTREKLQNLHPATLHRLLKTKRKSIYFKHHRENPVPYDLLIIDESSMIDMALFAKLLQAINPETTAVILLGDKNQLASVEAGSLFGDLCLSQKKLNTFSARKADFFNVFIEKESQQLKTYETIGKQHLLFEHVIELRRSFRFTDEGGIGQLSKALIGNNQEELNRFFKKTDKNVELDVAYQAQTLKTFVRGYENYMKEPDAKKALKKLNDLRVLCAVREGPQGIYELNKKIENYLKDSGFIHTEEDFYENRPVMVTGNNYELGLFNGDIGIVRKDRKGDLKVCFEDKDGELKWVLPTLIDSAETVFVMTIHKSQGSEFNKVLVVLPENPDLPLLTRELLYTAVTRAKKKVIIQGSEKGILSAAQKKVERGSGIIERF